MPANKKKKKPAGNPARGFATTSVASKPREELSEIETKPTKSSSIEKKTSGSTPGIENEKVSASGTEASAPKLSPEEFEKQLEESELQLIVEKYAEKIKRDASRQISRLGTDRRLLRAGADLINSPKWLPEELMEQVLDLIKAESRFMASNVSGDSLGTSKLLSEEELIVRLWTLQQVLFGTGFQPNRVEAVIKFILDIATSVSNSFKDSIWGLEEALDWLARHCDTDELPSYESKNKPALKGMSTLDDELTCIFTNGIERYTNR